MIHGGWKGKLRRKKSRMRRLLYGMLILILFHPVTAFGNIQTITHTATQVFGGSQSPDDARTAAVAKAKREALKLAGTYIESTMIDFDWSSRNKLCGISICLVS